MSPDIFFATYKRIAVAEMIKSGVPASITLAQAALESRYGESELTKTANNFFGVKTTRTWTQGEVTRDTTEYVNNKPIIIPGVFKRYNTPADSFADHSKTIVQFSKYKSLLYTADYKAFANKLIQQPYAYATDPAYPQKLIGLIEKYNLQKADKEGLEGIKKKELPISSGLSSQSSPSSL